MGKPNEIIGSSISLGRDGSNLIVETLEVVKDNEAGLDELAFALEDDKV